MKSSSVYKQTMRRTLKAILLRTMYLIILLAMTGGCFYLLIKGAVKNREIEKAVMKPSAIESYRTNVGNLYKDYFIDGESQPLENYRQIFRRKMKVYGADFVSLPFNYGNSTGVNIFSALHSRREGHQRCFLLTFNSDNPIEMIAVNSMMEEFFHKQSMLGLTLLFLGYDGHFKNFGISTRKFLSQFFTEQKGKLNCNFIRDGLSLEAKETEATSPAIFYYPC